MARAPLLRNRLLAVSACAALGWSSAARAQPEEAPATLPVPHAARAMTLAEAIAYAHDNQPAIKAALARIDVRRAAADVPRAEWEPQIGVTAQLFGATANNTTASYLGPGDMDIPRIGGTPASRAVSAGSWQPYASTFVGASVTQEAFDFGRIAAQTAAEDAKVDVERQRAAEAMLDVRYDVEEAYFAVWAARDIVTASDQAYERARVHRGLARSGVDSGLRPPIELTRAEADLTRFDTGRIRARGGLQVAQTVLAAAVGVPDASLDVAAQPPAPAELPSLDDAIQRAAARDPRILRTVDEIRAQEASTRAIAAETRPELLLSATMNARAGGAGGQGVAADGDGFVPYVPNWDVGVVLSWPLFDGTVKAREDASRAVEAERRGELTVARYQDAASIREAYTKVQVARAALPALRRALGAAEANYSQADARFRGGLGTSVELADAEALRTDAQIQLALGAFELARARAAFGRAIAEG
jgi:outer membrane protein TolC